MCQFTLTAPYRPGACVVGPPPGKRLSDWLQSARHESGRYAPLSDFLDRHELKRLVSNAISMIVLGGMLAWSIRAQGSLRFRLHVRTLMIVVAAVPIVLLGGQEVWAMWERFEEYSQCAEFCSEMERTLAEESSDLSDDPESHRRLAEKYRLEKHRYQRAAWRPWRAVDHL